MKLTAGPPKQDYRVSRAATFKKLRASLGDAVRFASSTALLAGGDSRDLLNKLPSHSVSLILTDPPYHATKKPNIYGDRAFEHDQHYLEWMKEFAWAWKRVLKPNGSLFCFCASSMAAQLEIMLSSEFNVLSHIVWTKPNDPGYDGWKGKMNKEALRQWYPHSERILFAEPAIEGNLHRSPFAQYLRDQRRAGGLSCNELAGVIGAYGRVNHGGAVSNWETGRNIPSREQYAAMCDALLATGCVASMLPYEDAVRPFAVNGSIEFTDVWNFPSVRPYLGKHPAEKPAELLEHAIAATTFPGDIVLDCFAGSGSTALAALALGRRSVSMEIESRWLAVVEKKLHEFDLTAPLGDAALRAEAIAPRRKKKPPQLPLFTDAAP